MGASCVPPPTSVGAGGAGGPVGVLVVLELWCKRHNSATLTRAPGQARMLRFPTGRSAREVQAAGASAALDIPGSTHGAVQLF